MNAHVERRINTGLSKPTFLSRAVAWLNAKWQAHRACMIEKEAIAYLRSLDRSILEDIGVNVNTLYKSNATIAHGNAHIIATTVLMAAPPSAAEKRRQQ